jgi:hypothetical protein
LHVKYNKFKEIAKSAVEFILQPAKSRVSEQFVADMLALIDPESPLEEVPLVQRTLKKNSRGNPGCKLRR